MKIRKKMPIEQRAKQFIPFAALKGLPEALLEKERALVPGVMLPEETAEERDVEVDEDTDP